MSDIKEILYFYSKFSPKCKVVSDFITRYKIPVSPVSVDKKAVRNVIRRGENFSIGGVPTIVIVYSDGEIEKYEGKKVLEFLNLLVSSQRSGSSSHSVRYEDHIEEELNEGRGELNEENEEFEEEDNDVLEPLDTHIEPKRNVKEQKMKTIKDIAKQMEEERKRAYGLNNDGEPLRNEED